jgi:hypothetical protein
MNSSELTDSDIHTARRNAVGVNAGNIYIYLYIYIHIKKYSHMNSSELTNSDIHTARCNAVGINDDKKIKNKNLQCPPQCHWRQCW